MKFGFHCYLFTDRWSDRTLGILDTAATLEANCVEIAIGDDVIFDPRLTRRCAESLGIGLTTGPGGLWPVQNDLSLDDRADRRRGLSWHRHQVDVTAEMGAMAYTGALYGHPGTVLRRASPPDEYPRTAEGLHDLAEYAALKGIEIVLEPMSHFRTHIANTPAQVKELIRLADHPNLRVLFDTYHMVTEVRDFGDAIRGIGPLLWGLHACESDRGAPGGGLVPWEPVFEALRQIDFDGYAMLETYNSSIGDFAFRRGMFHNVCPDGEAFAREGLRFLREQERIGRTG